MAYYYISDNFLIGNLFSSTSIVLNEKALCGLIISSSTITGSLVTFLGSRDGINFYPIMNNSSSEVTLTVSASPRCFSLNWQDFFPYGYVRARLGTSASSVMQKTYNTPIDFILRDIQTA